MPDPVLNVEGLRVTYHARKGSVEVLHDVGIQLEPGEILGVVGESGSGKSTLSSSIMRLLPPNGRATAGSVRLNGQDVLGFSDSELRQMRGGRIGMVFQDPLTSLNPTFRISTQMINAQRAHMGSDKVSQGTLRSRAVDMLERVGIEDAGRRVDDYPHQFSGGMRQRIMVATVLLLRPEVLICDEATSALDVTLQAQILQLVKELCQEQGTSVIVITHDFGVVASICDRVIVLNSGRIVEEGSVEDTLVRPQHPYTRSLLAAVPSHRRRHEPLGVPGRDKSDGTPGTGGQEPGRPPVRPPESADPEAPILIVKDLHTHYAEQRGMLDVLTRKAPETVRAVDGINLELKRGEIVGLVGESGSGKTTLGKTLLNMAPLTEGTVDFDGVPLAGLKPQGWRRMRSRMQMIFQETYGSLSPRLRVEQIITEPYRINKTAPNDRYSVDELLAMVDLPSEQAMKYPHELSGGQARRVGIARALAVRPELIIADEPTSGLDVSAAASVLNLLQKLREDLGLTLLLITHDLNMVGYLADRIAVMNRGKIVEIGPVEQIMDNPAHPYTQSLLASIPELPEDAWRPTSTGSQ